MTDPWTEAAMTVNGVPLTFGQSMTVRCALEYFSLSLEMGLDVVTEIDTAHQVNIQAIRELIHKG